MRCLHVLLAVTSLALAACGHKTDASPEKGAASGTPAGSGTAAAPGASAADASTLTVTPKVPVVGDKREDKESSTMEMTVTQVLGAKSREMKMGMAESTTRQEEVLAADGKVVSKLKVTYVEKSKGESKDGKDGRSRKSPVVGKTYVLEQKDGKMVVTDEKGKKVPKAEEDVIRKDHNRFGQPDRLLAAVPTTPIAIGQAVPELATAIQGEMAEKDDAKAKDKLDVSDVEVKLASIEGAGAERVGVFDVKLTLATPDAGKSPFAMKIAMTGQLKLRAQDGWPMSLKASGPLEMGTRSAKKDISATGSLQLSFETTYSK